uniref:Uncharacterized protein n=1 Tax=Salmonella phage vB_SEnST11_KE23 TaxID=3161174 RepID=A0AAU8GG96_9CAUD
MKYLCYKMYYTTNKTGFNRLSPHTLGTLQSLAR